MKPTQDIPSDWKLISKDQKVGDGQGFGCTRDLYEDKDGKRHSVRTSEWEWIESNDRVKK